MFRTDPCISDYLDTLGLGIPFIWAPASAAALSGKDFLLW